MKRDDIPLALPCGADFRSMPEVDGGRLCASCQTVVHDLSSMSEAEARAVLGARATERLCVRYLYDASGRVVFGGRGASGAKIVPDYSLTRKAKARLAKAALFAAPLVLFEACGGNNGGFYPDDSGFRADAGEDASRGHPSEDGGTDAGVDAADARAATADAEADAADAEADAADAVGPDGSDAGH